MSDIVERLRMDYFEFRGHALLREAADEIERLRGELEDAETEIRLLKEWYAPKEKQQK